MPHDRLLVLIFREQGVYKSRGYSKLETHERIIEFRFNDTEPFVRCLRDGDGRDFLGEPEFPSESYDAIVFAEREIRLAKDQGFMFRSKSFSSESGFETVFAPTENRLKFETKLKSNIDIFEFNSKFAFSLSIDMYSVFCNMGRFVAFYRKTTNRNALRNAIRIMGSQGQSPIACIENSILSLSGSKQPLGWNGFQFSKNGWKVHDPELYKNILIGLYNKFEKEPNFVPYSLMISTGVKGI
jgi:hypothetical protein